MKLLRKISFYVALLLIHITFSSIAFYAGHFIGVNTVKPVVLELSCFNIK